MEDASMTGENVAEQDAVKFAMAMSAKAVDGAVRARGRTG
jgi:hypothetical protein